MNLQTKLITLIIPLSIVPLIILGGIAYVMLHVTTTENITGEMKTVVKQLNHQITSIVDNAQSNILSFSKTPRLKQYLLTEDPSDRVTLQYRPLLKLFKSYQVAYPTYYEIRLILPDGYEDVRSTKGRIKNFSDIESGSEFFQHLKASTDQPITTILKNPDNNAFALYSGLKVRLNDPGIDPVIAIPKLRGYLAATIDLTPLSVHVENLSIGKSGRVAIVYKDGQILFGDHPESTDNRVSEDLLSVLNNCGVHSDLSQFCFQSEFYSYLASTPHPDIRVITWIDNDELIAASERLEKTVITTVIISIIVTILLTTLVIRRFVITPVHSLINASNTIGTGNLSIPLTTKSRDELGKLGHAFDDMRVKLKELQQRVNDDKEQLEIAKDNAETANRAKTAFLANMSHEIRTPLSAIIGYSETLLENSGINDPNSQFVRPIIRNGNHLLQVINDILDISKIEAGKFEIEEVEFCLFDMISDLHALVSPQAEEKGLLFNIEYNFPLPEFLFSDALRIKQVLINICHNALKFTEKGSIEITISYDRNKELLNFIVKDSGIGMTQEQLDRVFLTFEQADTSTTRKYGGTGLGLNISKRLTQLLGGDIQVQSTLGVGSQFFISVKAQVSPNSNELTSVPSEKLYTQHVINDFSEQNLNANILLAEDNHDNQALISMYLQKLGCSITLAENGVEALKKANKHNFDLILMDMQMPLMNGIDVTHTLRSNGYSGLIVALTANAMKEDQLHCKEAGCDGFLAKPVEREKFTSLLIELLGNRKQAANQLRPIQSSLLTDEPELADLIYKYVLKLPSLYEQIECAYAEQNWLQLKQLTHDLKSTSGNYGFMALSEVAANVTNYDYSSPDIDKLQTFLNEMSIITKQITLGIDSLDQHITNNKKDSML